MRISKEKVKNYIYLIFCFLIYSFAGVFSKAAANQGLFTTAFFLFAAGVLLTLILYALLWQQALNKVSLMTAFATKGIVIIFGMIWASLIFKEHIYWNNILGGIIIIIGIVEVASDE
ncbi:MAG: EamA family transporter [Anaerovoracaceae bacterium]